jgi:hypothetical protein
VAQFRNKAFKKLKDKWYARLAKEGFKDLEANEDSLIVYESTSFQNRYDPENSYGAEEYYRLAGQFFHSYAFADAREKLIWELHSTGGTKRGISDRLKQLKHKRSAGTQVLATIQKLKAIMLEQVRIVNEQDDDEPKRLNHN